jgi:EF-P beta-lysylation protein EpmB
MITSNAPHGQAEGWRQALSRALTRPEELLALLDLPGDLLPAARAAAKLFPLRVPRGYAARMRRGDPHDPLLRQVLPLAEERQAVQGFGPDPVGDLAAMPVPGLLHKYRGRALLLASPACAVHCRYCFRRHFPYAEATAGRGDWTRGLAYIAADATLTEVILSGGDPLILSDRRLEALTQRLCTIGHVRRLRVHTRLPVVLPERVDAGLLDWLGRLPLQRVVVIHANHANELNGPVREALAALGAAGATLLNQAVLLRGVNDDVDTQAALAEELFDAGVLPYYLHLLDPVAGAAHFRVPEARALALHADLRARLPGYLVPRLVREVPGEASKVPVGAPGSA